MITLTAAQSRAAAALCHVTVEQLRERRVWSCHRIQYARASHDKPMTAYWQQQVEEVDRLLAGLAGLQALLGAGKDDPQLEPAPAAAALPSAHVGGDGWWE